MGNFDPNLAQTGEFFAAESGTIEAIALWCECLHGKAPLLKALEKLSDSIGADVVALSRVSRDHRGEARVLVFDGQPKTPSTPKLERSFARSVLGVYFDKAKPGTTWFKSMVDGALDPALSSFHSRRRLHDLAIIPLSSGDKTLDFIEFHFSGRNKPFHQALMNMMADTLTRTWRNRAAGLFTDSLLRVQSARKIMQPGVPILSMDNPARLSRAEYRVCLLLSHGKTAARILDELGIGESTLRTHLRNVYAKTGTRNQSELVYQLLSAIPFSNDIQDRGNVA